MNRSSTSGSVGNRLSLLLGRSRTNDTHSEDQRLDEIPLRSPSSPDFSDDERSSQRTRYDEDPESSGEQSGSEDAKTDANLVTWDGPDDPENPLNWSKRKKWTATALVSCFNFISPVSSTMLSPALATIAHDFNITSSVQQDMVMSIFLLAYACGPFLLAPLSEMYGRVVVLQLANMVYLIFNTVCGFSQNSTQIMVFRFMSGLGGSAPQTLGGGVLSDCWRAEERGMATAIYSLAPFLGPAIGPIAGGYLTQYTNWRWVFWVVSMADGVVQILAFLFFPETYAPKILKNKAKKLRKETGNMQLQTEHERKYQGFAHSLKTNFTRPFIMLFTQPAIQITALYRAYLYGLMYLIFASFPLVWTNQYHQSTGRASLNYLSLGIGFTIGLQFSAYYIDKVYISLKAKYSHPGRPEFRVPLMFPVAICIPGGLLMYGLTAHFKVHWIAPNIGACIFGAGLMVSFQCAQTYITDAYEKYAASATGVAAFVRTLAGFSFPLFAPAMYAKLGIAWGNALLAGTALVLCLASPIILWIYGERIRKHSTYCAG